MARASISRRSAPASARRSRAVRTSIIWTRFEAYIIARAFRGAEGPRANFSHSCLADGQGAALYLRRIRVIRTISLSFLTAVLFAPAAALADPPHIGDDEGYSRLAQWESHLDERIAQGMRERWLRPDRAWRIQKELD